jgi:hypothetical protein
MARTKIKVPEEIIARACQKDSRHCMVAEAIKEANPKWKNIEVDLAVIRWTNPRTRKRYTALTPQSIRNAIFDFDQGRPVEPFVFNLQHIHYVRSAVGTRRGTTERTHAETERKRQERNPRVVNDSPTVIEGGPTIPSGHMGGSATSGDAASHKARPTNLSEGGNVQLSGGRYRQYGLRQLRA